MNAKCQRCGSEDLHWTVKQASFDVGSLQQWKVQLYRTCTDIVAAAVRAALTAPARIG